MRGVVIGAVAGCLLVGVPAGAFPGRNGSIAHERNGQIALVDADGGSVRVLIDRGLQPAWSADGTRLAYVVPTSRDHFELYVADADGSNPRKLTDDSQTELQPAWSPDGRQIAFTSGVRSPHIWAINADGTGRRRLTHAWDLLPAWSPDGRKIAYASHRHCARRYYTTCFSEIVVMNADGSRKRSLTHSRFDDATPAWSPDGSRLAYAAFDRSQGGAIPARTALRVMDANGRRNRRLTSFSSFYFPAWSPDGGTIVVENRGDLYVMRPDGSGYRRLTDTPDVAERHPDWQPIPPGSP